MVRLLHVSDLHFGRKNLPDQVEMIKAMIARERFDIVAVTGDLSQRARHWEFERAKAFLEFTQGYSRAIAVPGNHDCTWWRAPLNIGWPQWKFAKWRRFVGREPEPVLRLPGITVVGLNSAHGITLRTQTTRLRDLSVIGDLRDSQIAFAETEFAKSPADDRRVVLMHHNPVAGELSRRYGFPRRIVPHILSELGRIGVDLVLCGHDHQEALNYVQHPRGGMLVATAGTITTMSRGHRPTSVNILELSESTISGSHAAWDESRADFVPGPQRRFGTAAEEP